MNHQKTPVSRTLPDLIGRRAMDKVNTLGLALPGHVVDVNGPIVTVQFDVEWSASLSQVQVDMPLASAEYIRWPIQVNDKGVAYPASTYIGAVTGLGGPTDDSTPGRLEALVWVPVGNKNWSTEGIDPDALTLYAPNGVVLRDSDSKSTDTITPTNRTVDVTDGNYTIDVSDGAFSLTASTSITFTVGSHSIVINTSGISIDGVPFLPHTHTGGTISGDTGPVIP